MNQMSKKLHSVQTQTEARKEMIDCVDEVKYFVFAGKEKSTELLCVGKGLTHRVKVCQEAVMRVSVNGFACGTLFHFIVFHSMVC